MILYEREEKNKVGIQLSVCFDKIRTQISCTFCWEKLVWILVLAIIIINSVLIRVLIVNEVGRISPLLSWLWKKQTVGRELTLSSLEQEVWGSNLGLVKSDTVLPTARHCYDISWKGAALLAGERMRRCAPLTRYTLRRNATSIIEDLIWKKVIESTCFEQNRWLIE